MAYEKQIETRIDTQLQTWTNIEKKKMFGGVCYLINGNMCFGIWQEYLIVRTTPATASVCLQQEHVRPFDVTGRPMKGWIMVAEQGWQTDTVFLKWLEMGRDFALTLPEKQRSG
jgi:TfoX/Sxy family transcriptional regulator of competence genes